MKKITPKVATATTTAPTVTVRTHDRGSEVAERLIPTVSERLHIQHSLDAPYSQALHMAQSLYLALLTADPNYMPVGVGQALSTMYTYSTDRHTDAYWLRFVQVIAPIALVLRTPGLEQLSPTGANDTTPDSLKATFCMTMLRSWDEFLESTAEAVSSIGAIEKSEVLAYHPAAFELPSLVFYAVREVFTDYPWAEEDIIQSHDLVRIVLRAAMRFNVLYSQSLVTCERYPSEPVSSCITALLRDYGYSKFDHDRWETTILNMAEVNMARNYQSEHKL